MNHKANIEEEGRFFIQKQASVFFLHLILGNFVRKLSVKSQKLLISLQSSCELIKENLAKYISFRIKERLQISN